MKFTGACAAYSIPAEQLTLRTSLIFDWFRKKTIGWPQNIFVYSVEFRFYMIEDISIFKCNILFCDLLEKLLVHVFVSPQLLLRFESILLFPVISIRYH